MNDWSSIVFVGVILALVGPGTIATIIKENWRMSPAEWERWEPVVIVLCGVGFLVGICFIILGCGANQPEPSDPVTVEVTVCEPTLGGTAGQYLRMSSWCREVAICAATMPGVEDRETIREAAERYAEGLDLEFDDYLKAGRTGCYNGPVFREATEFLEEARRDGLFCRGP